MERIFVIVNASDILFSISGKKKLVLQQGFKDRHAATFMTDYEDETFFFRWRQRGLYGNNLV